MHHYDMNPAADDGRYHFVTRCDGAEATGPDIRALRESERAIARRTFARKLAPGQWSWLQRELGYDRSLPISKADWQIPYFRGIYRGTPAVFLVWSGFEYVFTLDGKLGASAGVLGAPDPTRMDARRGMRPGWRPLGNPDDQRRSRARAVEHGGHEAVHQAAIDALRAGTVPSDRIVHCEWATERARRGEVIVYEPHQLRSVQRGAPVSVTVPGSSELYGVGTIVGDEPRETNPGEYAWRVEAPSGMLFWADVRSITPEPRSAGNHSFWITVTRVDPRALTSGFLVQISWVIPYLVGAGAGFGQHLVQTSIGLCALLDPMAAWNQTPLDLAGAPVDPTAGDHADTFSADLLTAAMRHVTRRPAEERGIVLPWGAVPLIGAGVRFPATFDFLARNRRPGPWSIEVNNEDVERLVDAALGNAGAAYPPVRYTQRRRVSGGVRFIFDTTFSLGQTLNAILQLDDELPEPSEVVHAMLGILLGVAWTEE